MHEPIPVGIAVFLGTVFVAISAWLMLVGFHPSFRKRVHWGRNQKGPVAGRASLIFVAVGLPLFLAALVARDNFPSGAPLLHGMAALSGGAIIYCFVRDLLRARNDPNKPPLQTPTSGTPAAGTPAAPPPGIAGR